MILERIYIQKFGRLANFDLALGGGLNLICGDNESGKSTLLAFVRAMLYGLSGRGGDESTNPRKKYMPWGETSMGGSLRLAIEGQAYEIVRTFGATKKMDEARVINLATGETLPLRSGQEIGQWLLELDEETFCDTLFLDDRGAQLRGDAQALQTAIRNRAGTGREDLSLAEVLGRISSARTEILPARARERGQLPVAESKLLQLQQQLYSARRDSGQAEALAKEAREVQERLAQTQKQHSALLGRALQREQLEVRIRAVSSELAGLYRVREEQAERRRSADRRAYAVYLPLAAVFAATGAALGLWVSPWCYAACALAVPLVVLMARALRCRPRSIASPRISELENALEKAQLALEDLARLPPPPEGDAQMAKLTEELTCIKVRQATLAQRSAPPETLEKEIAALSARIAGMRLNLRALDIAQGSLAEVARARQEHTLPRLAARIPEYLSMLTGSRRDAALLGHDLSIALHDDAGVTRAAGYFSSGAVQQMYLALRLALLDGLDAGGDKLPLLMDDALLSFDDSRAASALYGLGRCGRQVVLMTCQGRERDLAPTGSRIFSMNDLGKGET